MNEYSFNVHWLLTSRTTHYGGIRVNQTFWLPAVLTCCSSQVVQVVLRANYVFIDCVQENVIKNSSLAVTSHLVVTIVAYKEALHCSCNDL